MTLTAETIRVLDGIPEPVFVEEEETIAAMFHETLVTEERSYRELWEELAAYSDEPLSEELKDEIMYADDQAGAAGLGGVLLSYLHRNDLPHQALDEVYGEIR